MKKVVLALVLAALALPVFADEALVLPAGVLRISVIPNYGFASEKWDSSGDAQDIAYSGFKSDGMKFFNLALAFEYGINDWITGAIQWTPGWNIWSTAGFSKETHPVYGIPLYLDQGTLGNFNDLFLGAKFQIIGKKAPVPRDDMRLSFAGGVKTPLPGASSADIKPTEDSAFVMNETDRHLWGIGFRGYYDYIFNENFFLNFFTELIYYPEQKVSDSVNFGDDNKVNFKYDLKLEVEPQYQVPIGTGVNLKTSLMATYTMNPDYEVEGNDVDGSYMFSVTPNVGLFFTKTFMPFELTLRYRYPIMGENTVITHSIALVGKFYLKF